jgi:hypothetical protein
MPPTSRIVGWKLDGADRSRLLQRFPPRYPECVADHVTLGRVGKAPEPWPTTAAEIAGQTDDGQGVQAMVVRIDGTTGRPDGSTYHITWSLGEGRKAQETNAVLKKHGWSALPEPITIRLHPSSWDG